MKANKKFISDETAMLSFGASLARACSDTAIIFLIGQLGAGKTTLSRGFLQELGHEGKVKSPTYTLVETYDLARGKVFHFDLYRIRDPQELEFIGLDDYFVPQSICLVEWPEYGEKLLPKADLSCYIELSEKGREITLEAHSESGKMILNRIQDEK